MNKPEVIGEVRMVWKNYRSAAYLYMFGGAVAVLAITAIGSKLFG